MHHLMELHEINTWYIERPLKNCSFLDALKHGFRVVFISFILIIFLNKIIW